ncbi:MAG: VOC family protein [Candidatus Altimarinota bacterium]
MDIKKPIGSIISTDLTIPNAEEIRDFYKEVIGWEVEEMPLSDADGKYADYIMKDKEGNWAAGVCHKRGPNVDLPPQWIVYINVEDIGKSIEKCRQLGGKILKEVKNEEKIIYALIEDPAGAILALTKI